jgi:Fe-S cluster biogenesis protein NfuA
MMVELLEKRVQDVLDEIRPRIQADGGDVEFVSIQNGIVKVRLVGACAGCPMSALTLKQGIEVLLKQKIPEIIRVEAAQ